MQYFSNLRSYAPELFCVNDTEFEHWYRQNAKLENDKITQPWDFQSCKVAKFDVETHATSLKEPRGLLTKSQLANTHHITCQSVSDGRCILNTWHNQQNNVNIKDTAIVQILLCTHIFYPFQLM